MLSDLEKYRKQILENWWNTEIEPKITTSPKELKDKLIKIKEGFYEQNVKHDAYDDLRLKSQSIEELQKEFDDFFNETGRKFLKKVCNSRINAIKP